MRKHKADINWLPIFYCPGIVFVAYGMLNKQKEVCQQKRQTQ
jgi:hypothetical protein